MRKRIQVIIILAVVFAVYSNALKNGFVYDDHAQIQLNPWLTGTGHIRDIFLGNAWGFMEFQSNYYRPMMHIIYMLCHYLFGFSAWGYHLVNIGLHAGASVLVLLLVSRLGMSFPFPLLAAVLFAAHPIHTEAVTWVAGVPDTSMAFFGLLSLYLYTFSGSGPFLTDRYRMMSVAAFFAALFCKEPALMLIGVVLSYDYAYSEGATGLSKRIRRLAPFLAAAAVYLASGPTRSVVSRPGTCKTGLAPTRLR